MTLKLKFYFLKIFFSFKPSFLFYFKFLYWGGSLFNKAVWTCVSVGQGPRVRGACQQFFLEFLCFCLQQILVEYLPWASATWFRLCWPVVTVLQALWWVLYMYFLHSSQRCCMLHSALSQRRKLRHIEVKYFGQGYRVPNRIPTHRTVNRKKFISYFCLKIHPSIHKCLLRASHSDRHWDRGWTSQSLICCSQGSY